MGRWRVSKTPTGRCSPRVPLHFLSFAEAEGGEKQTNILPVFRQTDCAL